MDSKRIATDVSQSPLDKLEEWRNKERRNRTFSLRTGAVSKGYECFLRSDPEWFPRVKGVGTTAEEAVTHALEQFEENNKSSKNVPLPCPFCGNENPYIEADYEIPVFNVECGFCHASSNYMDSIKEAIEMWNRRPVPSSVPESESK